LTCVGLTFDKRYFIYNLSLKNMLSIDIKDHIATISLQNAQKANALNRDFWKNFPLEIQKLDENHEVRVIILAGEGKNFCAGIDLEMLTDLQKIIQDKGEQGRIREKLRRWILDLQEIPSVLSACRKPVIAQIQGACIGAGVDIITACDMRYCSADAYFSVKEIDLGIVADVGTLQRLPKIVPEGIAREWAYTGKKFGADIASKYNLVNEVFENVELLQTKVQEIAQIIAQKSPLTIRGTKEILNYAQDHSIQDGLNYVATWNAGMLPSADLLESAMAMMQKRTPKYEN
jgi:enoyl-CoA hydratase/carnithine racemase